MQEIFKMTPHDKQVMMFSATLSKEIRPVCKKFMQDVIFCHQYFLTFESFHSYMLLILVIGGLPQLCRGNHSMALVIIDGIVFFERDSHVWLHRM